MTVVSYVLGKPLAANMRGGDCRARDTTQGRNIYGPHRFATPSDLSICNGMIRLTVGAANAAPALIFSAYGPATPATAGTTYNTATTYNAATTYVASTYTSGWSAMGTIVIDSPVAAALLTGARIVRITPEAITIRLIAPAIADAYVTLRRGEPFARIQHGATRGTVVNTDRRVMLNGPPALTGTAYSGRVQEDTPTVANTPRFIAARTAGATVNAATFAVTVPAVRSAHFGAGVGMLTSSLSAPADMHGQLYDASRPTLTLVPA